MDAYLDYNSDLHLTPSGSIAVASGWDQIRQRIIRRFLTNSAIPLPDGSSTPADYVFSPFYGLSAGALIDQNPDARFMRDLTRRMRHAVLLDAGVDPGAVPHISITRPQVGLLYVAVTVRLISGDTGKLNILFGG